MCWQYEVQLLICSLDTTVWLHISIQLPRTMHMERCTQLQSRTLACTSHTLHLACPSAETSSGAHLQVLLAVAIAVQRGAEQAARALAG